MTNSENTIYGSRNFGKTYAEMKRLAEENTKLKAEIERIKNESHRRSDMLLQEIKQLEAELEQWQSTNLKLVCELTRIECENNQLKSELEQSVKLPKTDEESEKERMIIWLNDFCDKFAKCDQCIFNGRCKEFDEMDFNEIKSQYEEAEQHLKGKVLE